jgi:hypothetical protein
VILSAHQPQYLPWLGYFDKIAGSDLFVFVDLAQYKKREYQNRNYIKGPKEKILLTVPVKTIGRYYQAIKDVEIDNEQPWQKKHWNRLRTYLGKSPYWKLYSPGLSEFYHTRFDNLCDLNIKMTYWFLEQLGIRKTIIRESELETSTTSTERLIEICKKSGAKYYYSGAGGKDYLNEQRFIEEGLCLRYQDFKHPSYPQQYNDFLSHLSIVDLLMNVGPESLNVLRGVSQ